MLSKRFIRVSFIDILIRRENFVTDNLQDAVFFLAFNEFDFYHLAQKTIVIKLDGILAHLSAKFGVLLPVVIAVVRSITKASYSFCHLFKTKLSIA